MNSFTTLLSPKAVKDLNRLADKACAKIMGALTILQENPFPRGKLVRKIQGVRTEFFRLRVDKYRVFFMVEEGKIVILRVLNKKDADKFIQHFG